MGLGVSISEAHSRVCAIHDTPAEVAQRIRMPPYRGPRVGQCTRVSNSWFGGVVERSPVFPGLRPFRVLSELSVTSTKRNEFTVPFPSRIRWATFKRRLSRSAGRQFVMRRIQMPGWKRVFRNVNSTFSALVHCWSGCTRSRWKWRVVHVWFEWGDILQRQTVPFLSSSSPLWSSSNSIASLDMLENLLDSPSYAVSVWTSSLRCSSLKDRPLKYLSLFITP